MSRTHYLDDPCKACGKRLSYQRNYYMLKTRVWNEAHGLTREDPADEGFLCIPCVQRALDRKLTQDDFIICPVNAGCFGFDIHRFQRIDW